MNASRDDVSLRRLILAIDRLNDFGVKAPSMAGSGGFEDGSEVNMPPLTSLHVVATPTGSSTGLKPGGLHFRPQQLVSLSERELLPKPKPKDHLTDNLPRMPSGPVSRQ